MSTLSGNDPVSLEACHSLGTISGSQSIASAADTGNTLRQHTRSDIVCSILYRPSSLAV